MKSPSLPSPDVLHLFIISICLISIFFHNLIRTQQLKKTTVVYLSLTYAEGNVFSVFKSFVEGSLNASICDNYDDFPPSRCFGNADDENRTKEIFDIKCLQYDQRHTFVTSVAYKIMWRICDTAYMSRDAGFCCHDSYPSVSSSSCEPEPILKLLREDSQMSCEHNIVFRNR